MNESMVLDATFLVLFVLIAWFCSKIIDRYFPPKRVNPWIDAFIGEYAAWIRNF